jgi:hypothetical protein
MKIRPEIDGPVREVELSILDLRYEGHRMKEAAAEGRLLASIAQRGIEEPLEGVEVEAVSVLLNGLGSCGHPGLWCIYSVGLLLHLLCFALLSVSYGNTVANTVAGIKPHWKYFLSY